MADNPRTLLRDGFVVAGSLATLLGAFYLGRQTHPAETCCQRLEEREVEWMIEQRIRERGPAAAAAGYVAAPVMVGIAYYRRD